MLVRKTGRNNRALVDEHIVGKATVYRVPDIVLVRVEHFIRHPRQPVPGLYRYLVMRQRCRFRGPRQIGHGARRLANHRSDDCVAELALDQIIPVGRPKYPGVVRASAVQEALGIDHRPFLILVVGVVGENDCVDTCLHIEESGPQESLAVTGMHMRLVHQVVAFFVFGVALIKPSRHQ